MMNSSESNDWQNKQPLSKLILKVTIYILVGGQLIAYFAHSYWVWDWEQTKNNSKKVVAEIANISQGTETRRSRSSKGTYYKRTKTVYHVTVKVHELNRTFMVNTDSYPLPIGESVEGYVDFRKPNEISIEGMNKNLPAKSIFHIAAFLVSLFFALFIGVFLLLPAAIFGGKSVNQLLDIKSKESKVG